MFDFLKKKIGGFISGLTKKEEENSPQKEEVKIETKVELKSKNQTDTQTEPHLSSKSPVLDQKKVELEKKHLSNPKPKELEKESKVEPEKLSNKKTNINLSEKKQAIEPPIKTDVKNTIEGTPKEKKVPEIKSKVLETESEDKKRLKLGIVSTIKSVFSSQIEIKESDIKSMLDDLELELLESDVDLFVAEQLKESIRSKLSGKKVEKKDLQKQITNTIRETLIEILSSTESFDLLEKVSQKSPLKIMFIGINGAGKTTTIAKVANLFLKNNKKVVFAAADTFRAAAIEQLSLHAQNLGVRIIKREYGSDPTSVAFDAVNFAKAHNIDAVLIDTAGRQDTNISLLNEMKKMRRVIEPDLTIYIGESISGNAIIEQISAFKREIGVDGVILTKLDCDPKGGTMLSINKTTNVPIIYLGIGQKYEDLEKFDAIEIARRIVE